MAEILQFPCLAGNTTLPKRRTRGAGKMRALQRNIDSGDAYKPQGLTGTNVTTVPLNGSVLLVGDTLDDFEQRFIANFMGEHLAAAMAGIRKIRGPNLTN